MFVPIVEIGTELKITFTDYYQQKQLCTIVQVMIWIFNSFTTMGFSFVFFFSVNTLLMGFCTRTLL